MKRSGTFKIILAFTLVLTAILAGLTWGLSHYLSASKPVAVARPVKVDPAVTLAPAKAALAAPPSGQPMRFTVHASVSTANGPDVSIEAQPTGEPCEEPRWLDARHIHAVRPKEPLDAKANATWCLRLVPGQRLEAQTLPGRWLTFADKILDLDGAHQYMRVQHASGRWLSIRAVAAGYCASESSACSGTALVEVSVDDRNLLLPVVLSSKSRDVLRLTSGDELAKITQREAAAAAERAAARAAATEEHADAEDAATPAPAPEKSAPSNDYQQL